MLFTQFAMHLRNNNAIMGQVSKYRLIRARIVFREVNGLLRTKEKIGNSQDQLRNKPLVQIHSTLVIETIWECAKRIAGRQQSNYSIYLVSLFPTSRKWPYHRKDVQKKPKSRRMWKGIIRNTINKLVYMCIFRTVKPERASVL